MIAQILLLLSSDDFYNQGETIDIAKGKYKIPLSFKEARNSRKRK